MCFYALQLADIGRLSCLTALGLSCSDEPLKEDVSDVLAATLPALTRLDDLRLELAWVRCSSSFYTMTNRLCVERG